MKKKVKNEIMKMISSIKNPQQKIFLSEIQPGECFATSKGIWIKSNRRLPAWINCINLNSGELDEFEDNRKVMKVYCELHHEPVNFSKL